MLGSDAVQLSRAARGRSLASPSQQDDALRIPLRTLPEHVPSKPLGGLLSRPLQRPFDLPVETENGLIARLRRPLGWGPHSLVRARGTGALNSRRLETFGVAAALW